ncbi:MAG: tRNA uridine-5-carboxymethylaminomethyl(34) synthesis GTPase MnmE [Cephaloticoccus sp.]
MASPQDTIVALATPAGTSAIALLRISGQDTVRLARELTGGEPTPRLAQRTDYRDRAGTLLDDLLCTFFRGPASYTGEDTLEITCHGNPYLAQRMLEDLIARGCRLAEPGEFTQRAFLNGRMDLSQAEAVMDLIHARGERALAAANQQLRGALGRHVSELIERLLGALARLEAYIDFPEEDLPAEDQSLVLKELEKLQADVSKLLATNHYGSILRDGLGVVILGEPNAGKSSLLNALVGRERALVSDTPGTTRDYLEERILLGEHCLRLVDTAGLNPTPEAIERRGIALSLDRLAEADLVLLVLDRSRPPPALPPEVLAQLEPKRALLVLNKLDLPADPQTVTAWSDFARVEISALTRQGLDELKQALAARAQSFHVELGADLIAINARHADALVRASEGLALACENLKSQQPIELVSTELRGVLASLGEIAGKVDNERMLDQLFASFCIGK